MKAKNASNAKNALKYIFNNFGVPKSIQSDSGKEFKNLTLQEYLIVSSVVIVHGSPRDPNSQGQIERAIQTIKRWRSKKLYGTDGNRWNDFLDGVAYVYSITVHHATSKAPFLLFHGQPDFDAILSGGMAYDTPSGLETYGANATDDSHERKSYEQWDFNPEVNGVKVKDEIEITENEDIDAEVASHLEKYKQKTTDNKNSILVLYTLNPGDRVSIKKDFWHETQCKEKTF